MTKTKLKLKWLWLKSFFNKEIKQTHVAGKILVRIMEGKKTTSEQIKFLKEQSIDIAKVLGIIGVQVIPGSSAALIALECVGKKHGFTIFPKEHELPKME